MGHLRTTFRTDYDHFQGCPLAPIELIQYGDFQCEYCAGVYPVIKWLQDSFGAALKFVYRHYPIPTRHPLALQAAIAAEAAALQGKFWYMHDMIFENQKFLTQTSFGEFARQIDLETQSFENCREHRKLFQKVISDFESGVKSGVDSSPTFFINGERYHGFDDFDSLYSALQNVDRLDYRTTGRTSRSLR
jgi:protein-disulfide isomerase